MKSRFFKTNTSCSLALAIAILICFHSVAVADHELGQVMYLDVTESSFYGPPQFVGNDLIYDSPVGYLAEAAGGGSNVTEGPLSFTVMGNHSAVTSFDLYAEGLYSLSGTGTEATNASFRSVIAHLTIFEIDGNPVASPVILPGIEVDNVFDLSNGAQNEIPWSSTLSFDINAALADAGLMFQFGATKFDVATNNILTANGEASSLAQIEVNRISIAPQTVAVPEPSGVALAWLVSGSLALIGRRRRDLLRVVEI